MQTLGEVIYLLKESKKITSLKDLAEKIGYNYSYLSRVNNDPSLFTIDLRKKISKQFNLDALMVNEPPMEYATPIAQVSKQGFVPNIYFVPAEAHAGFSTGNTEPIKNHHLVGWYMPFLGFEGWAFKCNGQSMNETIMDGEYLIVEKNPLNHARQIVNEHLYVIETKSGEYVIKRIRKQNNDESIWIVSDNPDYKDNELSYEHDVKRIFLGKKIIKWDLSQREIQDKL